MPTRPVGDRSTIFYNPFRKKWVFSIRSYHFGKTFKRVRSYRESDQLLVNPDWDDAEESFWSRTDHLDVPDPAIGDMPQLYNLDAIAYESVMLGLFEIHLGPHNNTCARGGFPKTVDVKIGFSRDGFHWDRPSRDAFIPSARREGAWDRGYVQSVGGCCLVFENELRFYYSGFRGAPEMATDEEAPNSGMYANGSTGVATLRRDGFASLDAHQGCGAVTTRPLSWQGQFLFVNADAGRGAIRAEVLDEAGRVMPGYDAASCIPFVGDRTKGMIAWRNHPCLPPPDGRPKRLRFHVEAASLYAFWVSRKATGESDGFLAAGSKDYAFHRDV